MYRSLVCLLLGILIFSIYANALDNGFVFDDYFMVVDNRAIRLPVHDWPAIFGFGDELGAYRPVRTLSYAIDYRVGGLHPVIYHFSNVLYHWLAACLTFFVARRLMPLSSGGNDWTAFWAALLWALHPIQTDSVTYISGRRDILAGLFFFFGLYAFLRLRSLRAGRWALPREVGWGGLAVVAFLLGALSKEAAFVLPLVFFAYDLCREQTSGQSVWRSVWLTCWRHKWLYVPFFFAVLGAFWYYRFYLSDILEWHGDSPLATWATVPRIWIHYIWVLLFPVTLNADYSGAFPLSVSFLDGRVLLALVGIGVLVAVVFWWLRKEYRLPAFCGLWFFITLLPVSHLLPHPELVAEHYLYLPSFGFCLLMGLGLTYLAHWWGKPAGYGIVVVLVVLYSARTVIRNQDWQNEVTLWQKTVATAPASARAHHNLGVALRQTTRDLRGAEQAFQRAIEVDPAYGPAYTGLAEVYLDGLRFDAALAAAKKGVELRPRRVWSHWVLGLVHYRRGEYADALHVFEQVVSLQPDFAPAYQLLVTLYRIRGEEEKAREWQSRFPLLPPFPSALIPRGVEGREVPNLR